MSLSSAAQAAQEGSSTCPGTSGGTASASWAAPTCAGVPPELVRSVLERIGDKWSVIVICRLGPEPRRFNELRRLVDGITQRMLTATLRGLERDGLVTRTVFPTAPLRVEYALTESGRTLLDVVQALVGWAGANAETVHTARTEFDRRAHQQPAVAGG